MAFAGGLLTARYSSLRGLIVIDPLVVLSIVTAICIGKLALRQISNAIWGNLLLMITFVIGYFHMCAHMTIDKDSLQSNWSDCEAYIGTISSFPTNKGKFVQYELEVNKGTKDSAIIHYPTKILLYEKNPDSLTYRLCYGDKIRVEGTPALIQPPRNPDEFDYSAYMVDRGIYLQHFVDSDKIELISRNEGNDLMHVIYRLRSRFEQMITSQIHGKKEQAVAMALLLGIKGRLDPEIKTAYASAGAMHVLAVSGLHVSVVCFILNGLFKLFPSGKSQRILSTIASISALWMYALLTGLSPSILRAVSMFSIILFSNILNRRNHAFNLLAFTAFALLLFNPYFLFNVGFQLSFLAVSGILYTYPKIYSALVVTNWLGDKVWQLTSVSLAAQIATFPLGLYYFHQFPTYFLLTNLIVIPAAFLVMILGLCLITFGSWFGWIGWLLERVAFGLNWFVLQVGKIDGSALDWIYISPMQVGLIYVLIGAWLSLLHFRKPYYMWLVVIATLGIAIEQSLRIIEQSNKKELLFYSTNQCQLIDKVTGFEARLFTLDSANDIKAYQNKVAPFRLHHSLPYPDRVNFIDDRLSSFAKLQVLNERKILYFVQPFDRDQIFGLLKTDVVVIANQSIPSLAQLAQIVIYNKIILDSTNGSRYSTRIKKEAQDLGIEIIDLKDQSYRIEISGNQKFLDMFFERLFICAEVGIGINFKHQFEQHVFLVS